MSGAAVTFPDARTKDDAMRYQDAYPSDALLRSFDVVRPRAAELLEISYPSLLSKIREYGLEQS